MTAIAIVAYRLKGKSISLRVCLMRGTRARLYDARLEHMRALKRAVAQKRIRLVIM